MALRFTSLQNSVVSLVAAFVCTAVLVIASAPSVPLA
ncbi:hypothetical protein FHT01_001468 [Sphingomonas japonica]|uniref:Uncharacterized protein n=1 Tax=Sphingomonas japonica TaxID=511662 RepID=A0ABX0U026_9SPHN|nr:hypothetical protein [Sphingomonas japonica]